MAEETDIVEASIVCLGNFNPAIFSPAWMRLHGLISEGQLEAAQVNVIHNQIAQFSIEHLTITVEPERFVLKVTSDPVVKVADLAMQIFGDILPETPVRAVGLNYGEHWKLDSPRRRLVLGRTLAPIEPWGSWGKSFKDEGEETAGLQVLQMKQPLPNGAGFRLVTVEPSSALADGKDRSVHLATNHHRDLDASQYGTKVAVEVISEEFDEMISFAKGLIEEFRSFSDQLDVE